MARVVWSEQSLADLEAILNYLGQESPAVAKRYANAVVDRVSQLELFPDSDGALEELPGSPYRQLLQGPYRIIYRQEGECVFIVTVHHSSRLLDRDLQ